MEKSLSSRKENSPSDEGQTSVKGHARAAFSWLFCWKVGIAKSTLFLIFFPQIDLDLESGDFACVNGF